MNVCRGPANWAPAGVGRALRDFTSRDEVVIATKVYSEMGPGPNDRGLSRKHIFSSIDASLKRLGTDYVDLYQIHRWDMVTRAFSVVMRYRMLASQNILMTT